MNKPKAAPKVRNSAKHCGRAFDISQRKKLVIFDKFEALESYDRQDLFRKLKQAHPQDFKKAHV